MLLQFLLTTIIAAILLVNGETVRAGILSFASRLAGQQGAEVATLATQGDSFDRCLANFLDGFYAAPSAAALAAAPALLAPQFGDIGRVQRQKVGPPRGTWLPGTCGCRCCRCCCRLCACASRHFRPVLQATKKQA